MHLPSLYLSRIIRKVKAENKLNLYIYIDV